MYHRYACSGRSGLQLDAARISRRPSGERCPLCADTHCRDHRDMQIHHATASPQGFLAGERPLFWPRAVREASSTARGERTDWGLESGGQSPAADAPPCASIRTEQIRPRPAAIRHAQPRARSHACSIRPGLAGVHPTNRGSEPACVRREAEPLSAARKPPRPGCHAQAGQTEGTACVST